MLWTAYLCPTKIHYVEALTPRVMLWAGALDRLLGLDEAMRVEPQNGIYVLVKSSRETQLTLSHSCTAERPGDRGREKEPNN